MKIEWHDHISESILVEKILDNAQVVNSEPVAFRYQYIEYGKWQYTEKFDDAELLEYIKQQYPQFKLEPLYATPHPAPDTVPRAEYDKLLDALKYYADKKNWGQDSQDLGMEVRYYNVMCGDMYDHNDVTKYGGMRARQAIAEAEGKPDDN